MRFSTASLFLPLLPSVTAWAFPSYSLDRREDSGGSKGWIVPSNVTVEDWDTAEPGEGWIPADEYMRRMGITPLEDLEDTSSLEERDIEALPLPPSKRGELSERAAGTRVNIGKKLTDYGCGASVRDPLGESLNMICSNGFCDQSITYVRTVDWLPNGYGSGMGRKQLRIDIKGDYRGSQTKGHFIEAAKRTVNPDSVSHAKRSIKIDSPTCMRWGICRSVSCEMTKFANFISIKKLENWETYISIDMTIKMNDSNGNVLPIPRPH
ncbi:hypothetical protein FIE12Z_7099 [Fusarium flagelliforme]|uniref:Uncharacterized protein n=1 Tax=Fusarium flagelliforme TaxID=2675880 RepID=A0A395ML36_9HYPO|nr:hypothetical protein FIE12Z_7099 [Fusarium flagelliforme]